MNFHVCWVISALVILSLAAFAGKVTTKTSTGILLDERGRFSLNHLQIVMWTILVLSSVMGVFFARLFAGESNLLAFTIPQELLILMGISVGSATVAGAAKSGKDVSGARVARVGAFALSGGGTRTITPHFAQVVQNEEGDQADQTVDITKFQNFIFTFLTGVAFLVLTWNQATVQGLPPLSKQILWLLGISHAGYIGGKLPTKS
jgi:hypothetical protein